MKKVERLSKKGRDSRETRLLRLHKDAWEKENTRLCEARRGTQLDLEQWRADALLSESVELKSFVANITEYESILYEERRQFEVDTVDPIWSLRTDLKGWVEGDPLSPCEEGSMAREDILRELECVKRQQRRIEELLQSEYDLLQSDIEECVARFVAANSNAFSPVTL